MNPKGAAGEDFASQLEAVAASLQELTALRNRLIVDRRYLQGASLRQIASEAGISHTAVVKILDRVGCP